MEILFYLFIATSLINILHFCFYLAGANVYDILQFRRASQRAKQKRKHTSRPLVTVVIPAHNEEKVIVRCLESVRKSSYRKLQIIVVDDASTDQTRRIVRAYIQRHAHRSIELYWKRQNVGKGTALNHALRTYVKGELVMALDADSILAKDAIARAVDYFDDPTVVGVAANVQVMEELTVLGLLQKFEHMIGYRSKKAYSLANCEFIIGGVGSTYRMSTLRHVGFYDTDTLTEDIGLSMKIVAQGNRAHRLVYGVDVRAMTEGVDTFSGLLRQRYRWKYGNLQNIVKNRRLIGNTSNRFSRTLTFYRMPMAVLGELLLLLEPFIIGYIFYLTFRSQNTGLVVGAYATITVYVLLNLWPDEHLTLRDRFRLSLYAPVAYFIFYIMNAVQLVAIVRCLYNIRRLISQKPRHGAWISPRRLGKQVTA